MSDRFKVIAIIYNPRSVSLIVDLFDDRVVIDQCNKVYVSDVDQDELTSARELLRPHGVQMCRVI